MIDIRGIPSPLLLGAGSATAPTYSFAADPDTGVYNSAANVLAFAAAGAGNLFLSANTLEQRNSTNAQTARIYNTTDGTTTNYERGGLSWQSNVFNIGTEQGGTGVARGLGLVTGGTRRWNISSTGNLLAEADATYDFGAAASGRANNGFLANNLTIGSGGLLTFGNRSRLQCNADGSLRLGNNAGSDFGLLQFGGVLATFPALKRSTTNLEVKLADDSAYTYMQALGFIPNPTATGSLPASPPEGAIFYDTTLNKLKFWNGAAYETVTSV